MARSKPHAPPKLPLTLHIGVTGHRPNRLQQHPDPDALKAQIAGLLKQIADATAKLAATTAAQAHYGNDKPVLRLLSSLAEGADRTAAECALAQGYRLQCPLPFERRVYCDDFTAPGSRDAFDRLLQRAEHVLQLDGERGRDKSAYRQAGRILLHHADIILAIWDGEEDETSVGTAGLVAAAQRHGLPLIRINVAAQYRIEVWDETGRQWPAFSGQWLQNILESRLLPYEDRKQHGPIEKWLAKFGKVSSEVYQTCGEPRRDFTNQVYRAFFAWWGKRSLAFTGHPYRQDAEAQWEVMAGAARQLPEDEDYSVADALEKLIHARYVHADSLAGYYADRYRGTFVLSFFLGGLAVLLAAFGGIFESSTIFSFAELITIFLIIYFIKRGSICRIHRHWLDFRLLAERLRQQAFMLPTGAASHWALPGYEGHDDYSHSWIDSLMRSVCRAEGIPHAYLDEGYRAGYRRYLAVVLKDQARYHHRNAERNENIVKFLEGGNKLFILLIIGACLAHILDHLLGWHNETLARGATVLATALPAFGAAFAGILSKGEFERIAHRSEGMAKNLHAIIAKLENSQSLSAEDLKKLANDASDIMSRELSDWRVIFRSKILKMEP